MDMQVSEHVTKARARAYKLRYHSKLRLQLQQPLKRVSHRRQGQPQYALAASWAGHVEEGSGGLRSQHQQLHAPQLLASSIDERDSSSPPPPSSQHITVTRHPQQQRAAQGVVGLQAPARTISTSSPSTAPSEQAGKGLVPGAACSDQLQVAARLANWQRLNALGHEIALAKQPQPQPQQLQAGGHVAAATEGLGKATAGLPSRESMHHERFAASAAAPPPLPLQAHSAGSTQLLPQAHSAGTSHLLPRAHSAGTSHLLGQTPADVLSPWACTPRDPRSTQPATALPAARPSPLRGTAVPPQAALPAMALGEGAHTHSHGPGSLGSLLPPSLPRHVVGLQADTCGSAPPATGCGALGGVAEDVAASVSLPWEAAVGSPRLPVFPSAWDNRPMDTGPGGQAFWLT